MSSHDVEGLLAGKVAVVTGGSRGLGRSISIALARAGANVVIASRKIDSCTTLAEEIWKSTGRRALPVAAHVGRWEDCDELVDKTYREFGAADVLVNNAGMSPLYDKPSDVTRELYDKVLDVNLRGPFRLISLFGQRMAANGGGSIINISSVAAVNPPIGTIPYSAAKAGLNVITVAFARALGPAVRVNCIMVGRFRTDVSKAWDMDEVAVETGTYALRRIGEPDEIAGTVLYLATDASSYTTGAILRVDGGAPY
jgi:NAD(P)-dependent dehydrogenase (short-subunit alcohol dehydrogenase family)